MKFIIPIIVGATIGYVTNWLAIKMLFRPYTKLKLFGITIPFTPGLIPKERERIAKSVGDAVGEHLLTPAVIKETLSSDLTNKQVELWMEGKYYSLKSRDESINNLLKVEDIQKFDAIIELLSNNITEFLLNELNHKSFKGKIIEYIDLNIYEEYREMFLMTLKSKGTIYLDKLIYSNETKMFLNTILLNMLGKLNSDDRNLKDIISTDTQDGIRKLLEENKVVIGNGVKEIFNDPNINSRLTKSISELVDQNISRVITMFISPEQISEKILQVVEKYINDPKANDDYIMLINKAINKLMDSKVSNLIYQLQPLIDEKELENITKIIQGCISNDAKIKLISNFEKQFIESEDNIKRCILENIAKFLDELIISTNFRNSVSLFVKGSANEFLNKPISSILERVDKDTLLTTISLLKSIFDTFAEHELPKIIEFFNVSKIVEKQINSFEVEYTEELILKIARKELKAITWVGALLGAFIGILSPLLQML